MPSKETQTYCPKNRADWRRWLEKNHSVSQSVWLVYYRSASPEYNLSWSEAVDEALCFGWIDSVRKRMDEERSVQFFSRRKPKSTWSRINKEKVEELIAAGKMREAGLAAIEIAKQNGSWTLLDEVEQLLVPQDLEKALRANTGAYDYFTSLSKSTKKIMLSWLVLAKRPETRQKRIDEIATQASKGEKPKQF